MVHFSIKQGSFSTLYFSHPYIILLLNNYMYKMIFFFKTPWIKDINADFTKQLDWFNGDTLAPLYHDGLAVSFAHSVMSAYFGFRNGLLTGPRITVDDIKCLREIKLTVYEAFFPKPLSCANAESSFHNHKFTWVKSVQFNRIIFLSINLYERTVF